MSLIAEQELKDWLQSYKLAILYFKSDACGVCHVHLPKLQSLAQEMSIGFQVIDLQENPHLSGTQMVFNVPVTKVFYEGKEIFKEGAFLDFEKLKGMLVKLKKELI